MTDTVFQHPHVSLRRILLAVSLLLQFVAVVLYLIRPEYGQIRVLFNWQFFILFSIAIIVSVALWTVRSTVVVCVLLLSRYTVVFLVGYPMGRDIQLELLLFASVIVESAGYLGGIARLGALVVFFVLFSLSQGQHSVFQIMVPPAEPVTLVTGLVLVAVVAVLVYVLTSAAANLDLRTSRIIHLDSVVTRLSDANIGFQSYVRNLELQVLVEERKRVSREIHDTVGYALTNVIVMLEAAMLINDPEKRNETLKMAQVQTQRGLDETRTALRHIRNESVVQSRGINMVHELVTAFSSATGIEIDVEFGNMPNYVNQAIDSVIFRFIQEGLTNAFRHGMATKIRIQFWCSDRSIRINMFDNGIGGNAIVEGIGIAGMRERLESVGGTLSFGKLTNGFKVNAEIPWIQDAHGQNNGIVGR